MIQKAYRYDLEKFIRESVSDMERRFPGKKWEAFVSVDETLTLVVKIREVAETSNQLFM
jgi:hypothetical protein